MIYAIHLRILTCLSLRKTSKALSRFVKRSHTAIRDWIQKYQPQKISSKKRMISKYIFDETLIKVGSDYIWFWVAIKWSLKTSRFSHFYKNIQIERNMLIYREISSSYLVKIHRKHSVSTDGGTWYPQAMQIRKS